MSDVDTHLWNADHDYYCSESNFYSNETMSTFASWGEFVSAGEADADFDMNLVFRWDWRTKTGWDAATEQHPVDPYYRGYTLYIFWMGQRKGLYRSTMIDVCRADEIEVRSWLQKRWEHLAKLWGPVS